MAKEYDPRMHSAEHILNQTMVRMFKSGRSFSAHIERKKSKCDYRFDRNLTPAECAELETRINEVVARNLPVHEEFLTREEAGRAVNLDKLPADAGDRVRIIRIGDYDACPCRGQHVSSTAEIRGVRIISTDYQDGVLRIRFRLEDDA